MPHRLPDRRRLQRRMGLRPPSPNLYEADEHVVTLRSLRDLDSGTTVVEFFAGWCGHCQAFAPVWRTLGALACTVPALRIAAVDCVANSSICTQAKVKSFPTVRLFGQGLPPLGKDVQRCASTNLSVPLLGGRDKATGGTHRAVARVRGGGAAGRRRAPRPGASRRGAAAGRSASAAR